ncbi:tRNA delta(2)-isopentenylpyrophosphate transferase, putative [Plasmodium ovale]|uniref:tRNA dimethylallyltransferase n=1 Tax=Plasmodium ovale TaxID=36330 RepID=A0A1C3KWS1_PLAOA|nr:tRNA delta(2)-isopentenylpyrophosphate transferase, putative [Plasmodium ovale]
MFVLICSFPSSVFLKIDCLVIKRKNANLKIENNLHNKTLTISDYICKGPIARGSISFSKRNKQKLWGTYKRVHNTLEKRGKNNNKHLTLYICNRILHLNREKRNVLYYKRKTNEPNEEERSAGNTIDEEKEKNMNTSKLTKSGSEKNGIEVDTKVDETWGLGERLGNIQEQVHHLTSESNNPFFLRDCYTKKKGKIIVIIGVTCSGKTKFSIDLCRELIRYNIKCEIISADSMQVYQNFSIGIAKVDEKEMGDIKHHMLDVCKYGDEFNVHKFVNYAIPIVEHINSRNMVAVVTGGTLLYVESLLWESVIDIREDNEMGCYANKGEGERDIYENKTNDELYEELKIIDPERAEQLHKNDRKRICRSLDIFYTYNKKHSELIKIKSHKNNKIDKTRYIPCFFYLDYNNDNMLKEQIEKRVNVMISNGLLDEVVKLNEINKNGNNRKSTSKGINQSIAYKEFDDYIEKKENNINDEKLLDLCKNNLIRKTYKYAKRQRRWIMNRFVKMYNVPLNRIDVSGNYEEQLKNALEIVINFLKN